MISRMREIAPGALHSPWERENFANIVRAKSISSQTLSGLAGAVGTAAAGTAATALTRST